MECWRFVWHSQINSKICSIVIPVFCGRLIVICVSFLDLCRPLNNVLKHHQMGTTNSSCSPPSLMRPLVRQLYLGFGLRGLPEGTVYESSSPAHLLAHEFICALTCDSTCCVTSSGVSASPRHTSVFGLVLCFLRMEFHCVFSWLHSFQNPQHGNRQRWPEAPCCLGWGEESLYNANIFFSTRFIDPEQ